MPQLNVNVDHVATLRQARLSIEPDPVAAAVLVELAGAHGITVHLREDRRHMQDRDIKLLRETVKTRLNLEMAAVDNIINVALEVKPDWATLVPEKRQELTTEGGLDVVSQEELYTTVVKLLKDRKIKVSFFVDPDEKQIRAAHKCQADFVEIHTGTYADAKTEEQRDAEFDKIKEAARLAADLHLRVNAGHGLNYQNVSAIASIPEIEELSIGHSIIARAVLVGIEQAVREMLLLIK